MLAILAAELLLVFVQALATPYPDFSWGIFFGALNQIIVLFLLLSGSTNYRDSRQSGN